MTTNQLFFALAGLLVTLFGMFGGFIKYYVDAKCDQLTTRIDQLDAKIGYVDTKIDSKIDPLNQQINRLIDYMMLHEGKIATLEEKTKKL